MIRWLFWVIECALILRFKFGWPLRQSFSYADGLWGWACELESEDEEFPSPMVSIECDREYWDD